MNRSRDNSDARQEDEVSHSSTAGASQLLPPPIKKRRCDNKDGEEQPTAPSKASAVAPSRFEQADDDDKDKTIAKLQTQVDQLKRIVCSLAKTRNRRFKKVFQSADEWKGDDDIVFAAFQGGNLSWWDLSDSMKYDSRVVTGLLKRNYRRLNHPVPRDHALKLIYLSKPEDLQPEDVMLVALNEVALLQAHSQREMWSRLPHDWLVRHKGLAMFGARLGLVAADDCPCLLDRDFIKACLEHADPADRLEWQTIPTRLRSDIDFARSIQVFPFWTRALEILTEFPPLRSEREVWNSIVDSAMTVVEDEQSFHLSALLRDFAPREILSDRELMIEACSVTYDISDVSILGLVDARLVRDKGFLCECADCNPQNINAISHEVQRLFPEVADRAISSDFADRAIYDFADCIAPEFWEDRAFVLRFFGHCGLPFLGQFPDAWQEDEEIFLHIARNCRTDFLSGQFKKASSSLRNKKSFMMKVVEIQPSLFECAGPRVQEDFDFQLLVFADPLHTQVELNNSILSGQVESFKAEAYAMLTAHQKFCSLVLPAISIMNVDSGCALSLLNQGTATALAYKKRIADFLNVPTGKQLRLLRQAWFKLYSGTDIDLYPYFFVDGEDDSSVDEDDLDEDSDDDLMEYALEEDSEDEYEDEFEDEYDDDDQDQGLVDSDEEEYSGDEDDEEEESMGDEDDEDESEDEDNTADEDGPEDDDIDIVYYIS